MRLFCHVSEFGTTGVQNIPCLVFLSEKLVLWSPSASLIDEAFNKGRSYLRSQDVLQLVRSGNIQVMGRKAWLTDPTKREQSDWPHATWDEAFDGELASIGLLEERDGVLDTQRKVRFATPERGWDWAKEIMSSSEEVDKLRVQEIKQRIREKHLPEGTLQKALAHRRWEKRIPVVLRDIRNHIDAYKESRATYPVVLSQWGDAIANTCGDELQPTKITDQPQLRGLEELLRALTSISRPRDIAGLQNLLLRRERPQLVKEIGRFLDQDAPIARVLDAQISEGESQSRWLDCLKSDTPFRRLCSLGNLIIGLATFTFTASPLLALVFGLLRFAEKPLRNHSILPAEYTGPKLPFVLAFDRKTPTYKQIREIHRKLLNQ